jgi:hypothetical protein
MSAIFGNGDLEIVGYMFVGYFDIKICANRSGYWEFENDVIWKKSNNVSRTKLLKYLLQ